LPNSEPSSEERLLKTLETEKTRRLTEEKLRFYAPYRKQQEFHDAGATHRERLLCAANQVGKPQTRSGKRTPPLWSLRRIAAANTPVGGKATDLIAPSVPGPLGKLPRSSEQRFSCCCLANPDNTGPAVFRSRPC